MEKTFDTRQDLIQLIIELELVMFRKVRACGNAPCQEMPETFRAMRWMAHSVLSERTLSSYLDDLKTAAEAGRNLMTEKYARMDNLIPPLKDDPEIISVLDEITAVEKRWMDEFAARYPRIVTGDGSAFSNYLRCELETYSEETLRLYLNDVREALGQGRNLAQESYTNLFKSLGYASLDEVGRESRDRS